MKNSNLLLGFVLGGVGILSGCLFNAAHSDRQQQEDKGSISGVIADIDGNPVAGGKVFLLEEQAVSGPSGVEPVNLQRDLGFSDENGRFGFADLPDGNYYLLILSDTLGAFKPVVMSKEAVICTLHVGRSGSFSGSLPAELLEREEPVFGRIDEINQSIQIADDGSFEFKSIPPGKFHLSFNFKIGPIDYRLSPLEIEIEPGEKASLGDSLFKPWKVGIMPDFGGKSDVRDLAEFGFLCTDSTVGAPRCSQYEKAELSQGISISRFPSGESILVELSVFDSSGAIIGRGQAQWKSFADSALTIHIE